ncbi:MAG: NAD(P)/FAD-dependent oxidoreductase [Thermotaleaceae bacterium]
MKVLKYDVLVIGGGPAGYYCALHCKKGGLKVALVEREELGGTGFRWGCLPVKKMLDACKQLKKNQDLGLQIGLEDLKKNRIGREKLSLVEEKMKKILSEAKVDIYFGEGFFLDQHTFEVAGERLIAEKIVIATGTSPCGFDGIPLNGETIISHREAVNFTTLPETLIIIGGNVEGCEFASLFAELGVKIHLIERDEVILKGNDRDLVEPLEKLLIKKGVEVYTGLGAVRVEENKDKVIVLLEDGQQIKGNKVLITGMRKANLPQELEAIGIMVEKNRILVDDNLRTNAANIYAIGDINGILEMAHVAIHQGIAAAEHILWEKPVEMYYKALPRAIFTMPEIAGAGYQEGELDSSGIAFQKGTYDFADTWRGFSKNLQEGFVKVLVDDKKKLLGIWMVGEDVGEYIGMLGVLLHREISIEEIKSNLLIHPSMSEAVLEALLNLREKEGK